MIKDQNSKQYDLEERTLKFAAKKKESSYWLKLAEVKNSGSEHQRGVLIEESMQFTKIFSSIVEKSR